MTRLPSEPGRHRARLVAVLSVATLAWLALPVVVLPAHAGWAGPRLPSRPLASHRDSVDSFCRRQLAWALEGRAFDAGPVPTGRALSRSPSAPSSGVDTSGESVWSDLPVPVRYRHAAVYDAVADRVVAFGGATNKKATNQLLGLSLSVPGASWQPVPTLGTPPPARLSHALAIDPSRNVVLMFGGLTSELDGAPLADAWRLALDDAPAWEPVSAGDVKPAGGPAAAVFDVAHDRFVVWSADQLWALPASGDPTWTLLGSAPLPPAVRVQAAYDAARGRMLVIANPSGAVHATVFAADLSGTAWTELWTSHDDPEPLRVEGAVIDPAGDRLVCFGGAANVDRTVWQHGLGGGTWSTLDGIDGAAPLGRMDQAAVLDPSRRRLVLFGGADYDVYPCNDTWALELDATPAWRQLAAVPGAREWANAGYDAGDDRLVVFSGFPTVTAGGNDTWLLDLGPGGRWRPLDPEAQAPAARTGGSLVHDAGRHRMLLFGGAGATEYGDLWALSLDGAPEWTPVTVAGPGPAARHGHVAVMDPERNRMLVMGGVSNVSGTEFTDVWALALDSDPTWTSLSTTGDVPASMLGLDVSLDAARDRVVAMSADGSAAYALSLAGSPVWTRTDLGATSFQLRHPTIYDATRDRFVMFGSSTNGVASDLTYVLELGGAPEWRELSTTAFRPQPRSAFTAVRDGRRGRMVVYGGYDGDRFFPDAWALSILDLATPTLLSLLSTEVTPGQATLVWQGETALGESVTLERAGATGGWSTLGTLVADASGCVRYTDRAVAAGERYGYRLRIGDGATARVTAETWVRIPDALALALAATNPLRGELRFGVTLPEAGPARIEMLDASGRRVATRDLAGLPAGRHVVRLEARRPPEPGIYWVRLTQGTRAATFKASVVR